MEKEMLKNNLLLRKENWKYYAVDEERRRFFLELLKDGYPYAIEIYFKAPRKFVGDRCEEFQNEYFQKVVPLYRAIKYQNDQMVEKKKMEEQQSLAYSDTVDAALKAGDENQVLEFLRLEIWEKSTIDILRICKRYHNKIVENKRETKEIHKRCASIINEKIKSMETNIVDAQNYFQRQEVKCITDALISDMIDEEQKEKVSRLLGKHGQKIFNLEYFERIESEYKIIPWLEVYIENFLMQKRTDIDQRVIMKFIDMPVIGKISEHYIGAILAILNEEQQLKLFHDIKSQCAYELLLKHYIKQNDQPSNVGNLFTLYLEKFSESGDAIYNVAEFYKNSREMFNSLPDIVEKYAKQWLLDYNFHSREDEIVNVIEALASVDKLEKLHFDFGFWKEMENCNAFICIIDKIALNIGFQECFNMIEENYVASKVYRMNSLASKWIQAANCIAINNEDAREAYEYFIANMMDENSMLDTHSKKVLIGNTIDYFLKQAVDNKKRVELEKVKVAEAKKESIEDTIQKICEPMEKLEKMLVTDSVQEMIGATDMLSIRDLVGKVRRGLEKAEIYPVEEINNWVKQMTISYNPSQHNCLEDVKPGEPVTCLSLGMMNKDKNYFEKATVKRNIRGTVNGNDV